MRQDRKDEVHIYIYTRHDKEREVQATMYLDTGIRISIGVLSGLILLGAVLPPGPFDPETGRIRFISDGFASYRWIAWSCFVFVCSTVLLFVVYTERVYHGSGVHTGGGTAVEAVGIVVGGVGSISGFLLVAMFVDGAQHYSGAVAFITSFMLMHICIFLVVDSVDRDICFADKVIEIGTATVGFIFFVCFCIFLAAWVFTGLDTLYSLSAVFEYGVFSTFIILCLHSLKVMKLASANTYGLCNPQEAGGSRAAYSILRSEHHRMED